VKYRVVKQGERFYPEKKVLWWWFRYYDYTLYQPEVMLKEVVSFGDENQAIDYVLDRTKFMSRVPYKIVFEYEE